MVIIERYKLSKRHQENITKRGTGTCVIWKWAWGDGWWHEVVYNTIFRSEGRIHSMWNGECRVSVLRGTEETVNMYLERVSVSVRLLNTLYGILEELK